MSCPKHQREDGVTLECLCMKDAHGGCSECTHEVSCMDKELAKLDDGCSHCGEIGFHPCTKE